MSDIKVRTRRRSSMTFVDSKTDFAAMSFRSRISTSNGRRRRYLFRCEVAKDIVPVVILVVYSSTVAGIILVVEQQTSSTSTNESTLDQQQQQQEGSCVGTLSYMGAFFFVQTLFTTIGYGNIRPCTPAGKAIAIVASFLGIPMFLLVITRIGKVFSKVLSFVWEVFSENVLTLHRKLCCRRKDKVVDFPGKRPSTAATDVGSDDGYDADHPLIPIVLGLLATLIWALFCAVYFSLLEAWSYSDAIYYVFISLLTIGLGDFSPKQYDYTIMDFFLLYIGTALLTMCIRLTQSSLHVMFRRVRRQIMQEYKNMLLKMETEFLKEEEDASNRKRTPSQSGADISERHLEQGSLTGLDDGAARKRVKEMVRKQNTFLSFLFSEREVKQLAKEYEKSSRMRNKAVQAVPKVRAVEMATETSFTASARHKHKVEKQVEMVTQETQTDPYKPGTKPHWKP